MTFRRSLYSATTIIGGPGQRIRSRVEFDATHFRSSFAAETAAKLAG
jgi:hypothetical protein